MKRAIVAATGTALALFLVSCETMQVGEVTRAVLGDQGRAVTLQEIEAGLKEALKVGTERAVASTSQEGGFADNPRLRIPPPEQLSKVLEAMRRVGLGRYADNFESRMNVAAEQAVAKATPIFVDAIGRMSFDDARRILQGEETAGTDYFRKATGKELQNAFRPVVHRQMEETGLVRVYNELIDRYAALPLTQRPQFDLDSYVTGKTVDGLFLVLAEEEAKIRKNPAARTTQLLQRVFGRQ